MSQRILFLDIDGVLVTWRSHYAYTSKPTDDRFSAGRWGDPDDVTSKFLDKFCASYGFKIVISSTWRSSPGCCFALLEEAGLKQHLHEDWRTGQSGQWRGDQIKVWLANNVIDIKDCLILDDDIDPVLAKWPANFIHCHTEDGLSFAGMRKMVEWVIAKEKGSEDIGNTPPLSMEETHTLITKESK